MSRNVLIRWIDFLILGVHFNLLRKKRYLQDQSSEVLSILCGILQFIMFFMLVPHSFIPRTWAK